MKSASSPRPSFFEEERERKCGCAFKSFAEHNWRLACWLGHRSSPTGFLRAGGLTYTRHFLEHLALSSNYPRLNGTH